MKVLVAGLGKMGGQIARKLHDSGHEVIGYDVDEASVQHLQAQDLPAFVVQKDALAHAGSESIIVWLMIPAAFTSSAVHTWSDVLPTGSMLIDGGNTDYRETVKHAAYAKEKGITFIDIGTSGGVWGLERGFSMMVGGDQSGYSAVTPILDTLTQPHGAHIHTGPSGTGHFTKMVHNAIEYGMMQSLAEGYRLLKDGPFTDLDIAATSEVWQHGSVIASWLNELTASIITKDAELTEYEGTVAESGEARWAIETAKASGFSLPAIEAALAVRLASQRGDVSYATKLLAALRNTFGGHNKNG